MKPIFITILLVSHLMAFQFTGMGTNSCQAFTKQKEEMLLEYYFQYSFGYLAGAKIDLAYIDTNTAKVYLKDYCHHNPNKLFIAAIDALIEDIKQ